MAGRGGRSDDRVGGAQPPVDEYMLAVAMARAALPGYRRGRGRAAAAGAVAAAAMAGRRAGGAAPGTRTEAALRHFLAEITRQRAASRSMLLSAANGSPAILAPDDDENDDEAAAQPLSGATRDADESIPHRAAVSTSADDNDTEENGEGAAGVDRHGNGDAEDEEDSGVAAIDNEWFSDHETGTAEIDDGNGGETNAEREAHAEDKDAADGGTEGELGAGDAGDDVCGDGNAEVIEGVLADAASSSAGSLRGLPSTGSRRVVFAEVSSKSSASAAPAHARTAANTSSSSGPPVRTYRSVLPYPDRAPFDPQFTVSGPKGATLHAALQRQKPLAGPAQVHVNVTSARSSNESAAANPAPRRLLADGADTPSRAFLPQRIRASNTSTGVIDYASRIADLMERIETMAEPSHPPSQESGQRGSRDSHVESEEMNNEEVANSDSGVGTDTYNGNGDEADVEAAEDGGRNAEGAVAREEEEVDDEEWLELEQPDYGREMLHELLRTEEDEYNVVLRGEYLDRLSETTELRGFDRQNRRVVFTDVDAAGNVHSAGVDDPPQASAAAAEGQTHASRMGRVDRVKKSTGFSFLPSAVSEEWENRTTMQTVSDSDSDEEPAEVTSTHRDGDVVPTSAISDAAVTCVALNGHVDAAKAAEPATSAAAMDSEPAVPACGGADAAAVAAASQRSKRQSKPIRQASTSSRGSGGLSAVALRKFYSQRYSLFSRFDSGIQLDYIGWFSVTPEAVAVHHAARCAAYTVLDAFGGCGGNTIQFAAHPSVRIVYCVERDAVRLACARHNAHVYGVAHKCEFILGDFCALASRLRADTVFLAPPWGGLGYGQRERFDVERDIVVGEMNGRTLLQAARTISPHVAYLLPRNVDVQQLIHLSYMPPALPALAGGSVSAAAAADVRAGSNASASAAVGAASAAVARAGTQDLPSAPDFGPGLVEIEQNKVTQAKGQEKVLFITAYFGGLVKEPYRDHLREQLHE